MFIDWTLSKIEHWDSFVDTFPHFYSFLEYGAIIAFLWVSKLITSTKIYALHISEDPIIRDYIQSGREMYSRVYKTRMEPKNDWYSVCSITKNQFNEIYNVSELLYKDLYKQVLSDFDSGLFVMKFQNQYIYRNIIIPDTNASYDIRPSNIRFILVEYKHSNLKDAIYLDIPKTAYITGNEILSKIHVMRCLEYQNAPFDENYTLHIMDNQLKEVVIYPNQWCVLNFDHYEIVHA